MKYLLPLLVVLGLSACQQEESKAHQEPDSREIVIGAQIDLYSEIFEENRALLLSLPKNYERNVHSYPVIFVLDGEYLFELTRSIVTLKASRNEMPESIIVGIPNPPDQRYDMAMQLSYPYGGTFFGDADGAQIKDYLSFFKEELIPFLRANYRVNQHHTVIGLSPTTGPVLEAFWNQSDLFDDYIVLAPELALTTANGKTVKERILAAIQDQTRPKSALYVGKASDDLTRRDPAETLAYAELNQELAQTANPNISYTIEILQDENHYGLSISGIEHGLETIYPFATWTIPYRAFWKADNPAAEIKAFYDGLSRQYGFEILPLEEAFYAAQTLSGTARRLNRQGRTAALEEVIELGLDYYPNSPVFG